MYPLVLMRCVDGVQVGAIARRARKLRGIQPEQNTTKKVGETAS